MEEIELSDVKHHFEVNCFGPLEIIKTILPQMREQGDWLIINITSIAADMGLAFRGPYSAAKGALERMSEALRMETYAFGIRFCNIAPGDFVSNIADRRHYTSLNEGSPYSKSYQFSLDEMNEHVNNGINPKKIVFSGVGKTSNEIRYAIEKKILLIKLFSRSSILIILFNSSPLHSIPYSFMNIIDDRFSDYLKNSNTCCPIKSSSYDKTN